MTPKATPHAPHPKRSGHPTNMFIAATQTVIIRADEEEKGSTNGRQMARDAAGFFNAQAKIKAVNGVIKVSNIHLTFFSD